MSLIMTNVNRLSSSAKEIIDFFFKKTYTKFGDVEEQNKRHKLVIQN